MYNIFNTDKETLEMHKGCYDIVDSEMTETLIWYFENYPEKRREMAEHFKYAFAFLTDQLVEELERNEEEEKGVDNDM